MWCEETRPLISMYVDDALTLPIRVAIDEHLGECPVCRAHLSEIRLLKQNLRSLSRPVVPTNLAQSINEALAIEAAAQRLHPKLPFGERVAHWLQPKLMPYTVGSLASVVLFVTVFAALRPHFVALHEAGLQNTANNSVVFVRVPGTGLDLNQPVNPENYAASRAPFAEQSPSLNPSGALAALTRSYSNPHHLDRNEDADDMMVVADVFSNGSAS